MYLSKISVSLFFSFCFLLQGKKKIHFTDPTSRMKLLNTEKWIPLYDQTQKLMFILDSLSTEKTQVLTSHLSGLP